MSSFSFTKFKTENVSVSNFLYEVLHKHYIDIKLLNSLYRKTLFITILINSFIFHSVVNMMQTSLLEQTNLVIYS